MASKGFLLVLMQPPPSLEEEFNAWYDSEHIPERLSVPGFETGLRFVCLDGHPRYLAMYDLAEPGVLETAAYKRVAYENSSPWTKRVTSRVRIYRSAGRQIYPGTTITGRCARLLLVRFRGLAPAAGGEVVSALRRAFEGRPQVSQVRVLANETGGAVDFLGLIELSAPLAGAVDAAAFGPHARAVDLINTYAPYL